MEKKPKGRPKSKSNIREAQINFSLTEDDAKYIEEVASACGFKHKSALVTAIMERLCIGGFSGVAFIKLGLQFSNVLANQKCQKGFYFGVRPFPPLIGEQPDPETEEVIPFINGMKNQIRKESVA